MEKKMEVIYYEMLNMEKRLTEKAEVILQARDDVSEALNRFAILQAQLKEKLESIKDA